MIKVIIADDDELIRESLKIILSSDKDLDIKATVPNGQEAAKFCLTNDIDVALLDVRMPIMSGVDATKEIVERSKTKVVILTTFDEDEYINRAIKFGAKGYILKNNSPQKIIDTIKSVYEGYSVMQQEVLEKLKDNLFEEDNRKNNNISKFSPREVEILEAIADGLSNKEIGAKLFISEGTVKNYITSILQKTGLSHRTQIAISYLKGGIK